MWAYRWLWVAVYLSTRYLNLHRSDLLKLTLQSHYLSFINHRVPDIRKLMYVVVDVLKLCDRALVFYWSLSKRLELLRVLIAMERINMPLWRCLKLLDSLNKLGCNFIVVLSTGEFCGCILIHYLYYLELLMLIQMPSVIKLMIVIEWLLVNFIQEYRFRIFL
jgi:hypothetical protein